MKNEPKILFEDNHILIVDKPSGLTVNRADTTKGEQTLQDFVEDYLRLPKHSPKVSDTFNPEEVFNSRAGIVHRLDKETSGILVVAKTLFAFEDLQKQFKERRVKKVYTALSHGKVVPEEGIISVPMGRLPWNRMRFGVVAGGRDSVTKYKILRYYDTKILGNEILTLLELYPETGRTHQIRVHLKHINHPIVSDLLYGGRKVAREDRKILPRMFLHASKLTLFHPVTSQEQSFESPPPKELEEFLFKLQNKFDSV